jgi:hypothetical protein
MTSGSWARIIDALALAFRDAHIARFTSSEKPMPPDVCVLVSTYNMLGFQGHRSNVAAKVHSR